MKKTLMLYETIKKVGMIALGIIFVSCQTAPRVISDLAETLPSRSADSVMVFKTTEDVPASARKIGTVKVKDGGLTPTKDCLFANMLALAVKKTAESGGNGFHIDEHKYPGFHGSTCHRVNGTMYLLPDSFITSDTRAALNNLELFEEDVVQERASRMITDKRDKRLNNPKDIFKLSAGPSWITSEIETYNRTYKSKCGLGLNAEFQHIWGSGLGIGINYLYFGTSFDEGFDMSMHYIGPSIILSLMLGERWRYEASLGVGLSYYAESVTGNYRGLSYTASGSESKVSPRFGLGIEYMLTKKVGLGFQFSWLTMTLKEPEGYDSKYDFYGIKRIDPHIGLRVYL